MSKTTVVHKYKWTLEEKIVLTVPSILFPAALAHFSAEKGELSIGWLVGLLVWVGCFFLLAHIGSSKKKISKLEAIFDPETTEVSIEGNKIYNHKTNTGKISDMDSALVKKVGQNPTLVLSSKKEDVKNINIPVRLASKRPFLEFLKDEVLNNESITKGEGIEAYSVEEYFAEAETYKR